MSFEPAGFPHDYNDLIVHTEPHFHRGLWITPMTTAERPTVSFMSRDQTNDEFYIDANGCLTERVAVDGQDVVVHYDEVPESDITSINGIRCTTALRTVIDIAPELESTELEQMVRQCLDRGLFTAEEAMDRVAKPDMLSRLGARLVRQIVSRPGNAG